MYMKFETIEQYYEYKRKRSAEWYSNPVNAQKKKEYQKKRYLEKREEIIAKNKEAYHKRKNKEIQE